MTTPDGPTSARSARHTTDPASAREELDQERNSRRGLFRMLGAGGATAALGTVLAACDDDDDDAVEVTDTETQTTTQPSGAASDLEILNYALTLEFLEADFYRQVLDSGVITDQQVADLAKSFGETEQEHVDTITATIQDLGGTPVEAPQTDFTSVLEGGRDEILRTAAMVENIGAGAYLGQAANIESPDLLAAALSIHTVEGRHAAALNALIEAGFMNDEEYLGSIPSGPFAQPLDMETVTELIQPFLAS